MDVIFSGADASALAKFCEYYSKLNPWLPFWKAAPTMNVLVSDVTAPSTRFSNTEFYEDWLRPNAAQSAVGLKLFDEPGRIAMLAVHYDPMVARRYNASISSALTALAPLLKAAVALNRQISETATAERTIAQAIEALALPAFMVDRCACVKIANARGVSLLERLQLQSVDGRVRPRERRAALQFQEAVASICAGGRQTIDIPLHTQDGAFCAALTLHPVSDAPMAAPGNTWMFAPERFVLVLVRERTIERALLNPKLLTDIFAMTPAEARLAACIGTGVSLEAAADSLSVSKETARSQLKQVFAKTDTHRQAELVALLAGIVSHRQ